MKKKKNYIKGFFLTKVDKRFAGGCQIAKGLFGVVNAN